MNFYFVIFIDKSFVLIFVRQYLYKVGDLEILVVLTELRISRDTPRLMRSRLLL